MEKIKEFFKSLKNWQLVYISTLITIVNIFIIIFGIVLILR